MIEIRMMKLSELRGREKSLQSEVDEQRRERASRYLLADDRLRCLAAGCLMKRCLPGYSEDRLFYGVNGKPFLHDSVPFSISHGGNYVALVWCDAAEGVGVDVEAIRGFEYYRPILPWAMTAREQRAVGEDARAAVRIWTRKESLYKCVGEGITDFRELPEVLEDQTLFFGQSCQLLSWEEENHSFSIALRNCKKTIGHEIVSQSAMNPLSTT